jgi:hypothetical protein
MRRGAHLIAGAILACASTFGPADAARISRLIYRVDRVSASIEGTTMTIDASGAVSSGGWSHPRLRAKPSAPEAHILQLELLADPPPPKRNVIAALLPVRAQLRRALPSYGTFAVSVVSQTNEITAQIRH